MTPSQLFELYMMEIEGKTKIDPIAISPILNDMQENDRPVFLHLMKIMNSYKRNLCVRLAEHRQTNISFDFEDELNSEGNV